ncbi:MAG: LD-carboxypeptidase, partial [Clostridia bacterium]|nr:LD-carboxypeptidase [Clostridia bacterium]
MQYLHTGSRLGLIAPSSPVYERENQLAAIHLLKSLGFEVKAFESICAQRGYLSGSDAIRARDIMDAFADPAIDGVVCLRGGYGCARLLPLIDYEIIRQNPKPFVGFSDITALHLAFYEKTRLITYHGPMPGSRSLSGLREKNSLKMWVDTLGGQPSRTLYNPNGESFIPFHPGRAGGILLGGNLTVLT